MPRSKKRRQLIPQGIPPGPAKPPPVPATRAGPVLIAGLCALLAIVTLAAYWGGQAHDFVQFDDDAYITRNAHVQKGWSGESIAWAFTSMEAANWHPLTWLSHMLDVQLFGLDAGRHHLTSILFHIVNSVLLFLLLFRMTGAPWRSILVAGLFALHPLHVESVAWIAERKDVLSSCLWFLTLGAWWAYLRSKKTGPYALAMAFFALGLMAKPMLVTLPFTLLLLDYWPLGRLRPGDRKRGEPVGRLLREKAPLFALSGASCLITLIAQRSGGAVKAFSQLPLTERAGNAVHAYAAYLGKMVWPSPLAFFYPQPERGFSAGAIVLSIGVLAGVSALAFRMRRHAPYLLFGWLWYLGTLVPVIGLVQVGEKAMADRYTYIPLIGIFIAFIWGIADAVGRDRTFRLAAGVAAVGMLGVLFALTRAQAGTWANSETLMEHALAVTSDNWMAHSNLGLALVEQGRMQEAAAHFREAVRIVPKLANARINLGLALAKAGQLDQAVAEYRTALLLQPDDPVALRNLGLTLLQMDRIQEAADVLARAVRQESGAADLRFNYGKAMERLGRAPEALEQYEEALRLEPGSAQGLNALGLVLGRMGRLAESIDRLGKAVEIDPSFAEARVNLGVALDYEGRTSEALEQLQQALKVAPGSPVVLDNLGLVLGKMNRFPEAIERLRQALRIQPGSAGIHFHLGITLARASRFAEARGHFQEALRIDPGFGQARAALEHLPGK